MLDVREGTLRTAEGRQLPLEATDVAVEIAGPLAEVAVTQTFANPLDRPIEATYLFPLPHGAAVHRMCFELAGRVVEGSIQEREQARREFVAARQDGHRATLLEQARPDLFTLAVTHIQPGERVKVSLAYHETLQYQDGEYRFVFPLVAADQPSAGEPCADAEELRVRRLRSAERPPNVSLCVRLAERTVPTSPTHQIEASAGLVTLAPTERLPNRDFVLAWPTSGEQVFLHRQQGLSGTFLVNLLPPGPELAAPPYDLLILLDRSSSLQGQATEQARRAVDHVLSGLRPCDGFQIVAFNHACQQLTGPGAFLSAVPAKLEEGRCFVRDLAPSGGTDLQLALKHVTAFPPRLQRPRQVLLITDANCTLPELPELPPVHVLGLGAAVNRRQLEELARRSGGSWESLTPFEEPGPVLERLGRRLSQAGPVLTDLKLEWPGALLADVYPATLPDLYASQPLAVLGRFHGRGPSRLVLTGRRADGSEWRREQDVELPERSSQASGLERVWARRRIDERLEWLETHPREAASLRQEVISLALRHSLASPYTSFVGVDQESLLGVPEQVTVAVPEVAGSPAAHREARALAAPAERGGLLAGRAGARGLLGSKPSLSAKPSMGPRTRSGLLLPRTPTGGDKPMLIRGPATFGGPGPAPPPPPPLEECYPPEELAWAEGKLEGALDLVFLVDETGSMGPFIRTVQENILRIVETVASLKLCRRLQLGLVSYRDHPPQDTSFVTRVHPLDPVADVIRRAVRSLRASGGGDAPEAVTDGFHELLNLNWRPGSVRTVVWIGDAPPHGVCPEGDGFPAGCPCGRHWQVQAEACREMGIVIHAVGAGKLALEGTEEVFRQVAALTRGHFVTLDRAPLLLPLITGVAAQDLDRSRIEQRVAELMAEQRVALSRLSHPDDRCEFLLAHLRQRDVRARQLLVPGRPLGAGDFTLQFAPLSRQDVRQAMERVRV